MKYKGLFALFLLCVLNSCIPNKRIVYMQNKENALLEDTILSKMPPPYRVQINDILSVRVKAIDQSLVGMFNPIAPINNVEARDQKELYFNGFLVDDHGDINMPTMGKINVLNLTIEEIKNKIEKELLDNYFKKEANIFVTVKLGGIKYTILGEIDRTGTNVLFQERVNIFEAIANSGDITQVGNREEVLIVRPYPGGHKMHRLDLTDKNIMSSPYFYIQPNDLIYIKPLPQKSWGTGKTGIESFTTIVTILSAVTTAFLLFRTL